MSSCKHQNAPHPASVVLSDDWNKPYSREQAAFPASWVRSSKFWPTTGNFLPLLTPVLKGVTFLPLVSPPVGRVDNVYGDRNLVCTNPPVDKPAEDIAA